MVDDTVRFPSLDNIPAAIAAERNELAELLDRRVPPKRHLDRNLLIATWNIRNFGDLSRRWGDDAEKGPKRNWRALLHIGEIATRFDVVAVQEVYGNLRALRDMLRFLNRNGDDWGVLLTDQTLGKSGRGERMAFLYDVGRVTPSGLAAEIVLDPENEFAIDEGAVGRQFARTPYAVSFRAAGATFILVTAHILYGKSERDRLPEVAKIAEWLRDWARRENSWHHNLLVLGDFNINRLTRRDGTKDPLWEAFTETGLHVPEELGGTVARALTGDPDERLYDQIAWFTEGDEALIRLGYTGKAGNVPFTEAVFKDSDFSDVKDRMSDHYPLWAEFHCPERARG